MVMKVSLWAEIRRLSEIERLSRRAIARRLHCCERTVKKALGMASPPGQASGPVRASILDPFKPRIGALIEQYPKLSAVRILEEIRKGPEGYPGEISILRGYLRDIRPYQGRVYQEVHYEPGQAMQVDWGTCNFVRVGSTRRRVSVLVAALCYSRMYYIEFCLSQKKEEFYRALDHAFQFFGGSPRRIIFDNLKAAVLNGSGRQACLHPEFLALCGHYCLEPVACERRDPESKGITEAGVRYVKHNALQGRDEELTRWEDYRELARYWRDEVANVRIHQRTQERPVDRFEKERQLLRPLPAHPFDTDQVVSASVTSHARVRFDANRYSVPPDVVGKSVLIRASDTHVRILYQGREIACHDRCYDRGQVIRQAAHELEALKLRKRNRANHLENTFDALGEPARRFHLELRRRPVKTSVHLRRLLRLVQIYGRTEVLAAIQGAIQYERYDAADVESLLLQERRRKELPSPTQVRPQRRDLVEEIDLEEPDPGIYDRLYGTDSEEEPSND